MIAYVTGGQGRLDDGNQYWDLKEGVAFIIPPGQAHRFTSVGDSTLKLLVYTQVMPQQGITPRQASWSLPRDRVTAHDDEAYAMQNQKTQELGPISTEFDLHRTKPFAASSLH